jgi:DNA-binding HxlR family transcriptional regulator
MTLLPVQKMDYPAAARAGHHEDMTSQTDYCPISMGVEVLGDRWTPLVIREMMVGSEGFNEIHRGIPRISRTLLAQRLRVLERQGLILRRPGEPGRPGRYTLTPAGESLTPIVWALGHWAAEWVFGDPAEDECDGLSLIWRMHQHAVPATLPAARTVIHVVLTGAGGAEGWLDIKDGAMSVCRDDQGLDVDLAFEADCGQAQRWIVGRLPFGQLLSRGHGRILGPSRLTRAFPTWFDTSLWADGLRRADQRRAREAVAAAV